MTFAVEWLDGVAGGRAGRLAHSAAIGIRSHFPQGACERWTAGACAAKASWTADFGEEQFSLGRAFYTHLEQGRSSDYFRDSRASDARVESAAPGLQEAMRSLAARFVGGEVRPRRGWCGPGIHVFPAGGHVATEGGVIHFDTEGLTPHHLAKRARALTLVAMLQPPRSGGGLRVWELTYDGRDGVEDEELLSASTTALYEAGDVVIIDSYRLHQIQPFAGDLDRISATIHLAEVDDGHWESWF